MKRTSYILLFFSVLALLSCGQKRDTTMSFTSDNLDTTRLLPRLRPNIWYRSTGFVSVDSLNTYNNEKSLRLATSDDGSPKVILTSFLYDLEEIDGDTIVVKGKYKLLKANDAKISFRTMQYHGITDKMDSVFIEPSASPDWKDFHIKSALEESTGKAYFYIFGEGDIDILLSNCRTWIDDVPLSDLINREFAAEKDTEFDDGSEIELGELTPQMLENLEVLGKVWGFMKYYHPEVTQGKYNWDYELFRVLPQIANAKDKSQHDKLLSKWIDKYGKIRDTADYTISDSTKYSRFIDLSWLSNKEYFSDDLIKKLRNIKDSNRSKKFNYYISFNISEKENLYFLGIERFYNSITWDDQGYRLLTLFRLWNVIEYCFPYTHYTDTSWETLLMDFLPEFFSPQDQPSYELAIMELTAKIDDSHGHIQMPNNKLHNTVLASIYNRNRVPVELTQSAEGYIVVKYTQSEFLHRGDIIVTIEGRDVSNIIEEMSLYFAASNINGSVRRVLPFLLSSKLDQMQVEVIRNGEKAQINIDHFRQSKHSSGMKSWEEYDLSERSIIHVDNIKSAEANRDVVQDNIHSKGLIIDMRKYPSQNNQYLLSPLILSKYPLWISVNDKSSPGNYHIKTGYNKINEMEKEPNFKGKITILVDENTQSAGETWAVSHRIAPNSVIIGRQTAGANGPECRIPIQVNIVFSYTW